MRIGCRQSMLIPCCSEVSYLETPLTLGSHPYHNLHISVNPTQCPTSQTIHRHMSTERQLTSLIDRTVACVSKLLQPYISRTDNTVQPLLANVSRLETRSPAFLPTKSLDRGRTCILRRRRVGILDRCSQTGGLLRH